MIINIKNSSKHVRYSLARTLPLIENSLNNIYEPHNF